MKEPSKEFIEAWEKHTGLEWSIDYQGGFRDSYRDFKAGWDAAKSCTSQPVIEADAEKQAGCTCITLPFTASYGCPLHGRGRTA